MRNHALEMERLHFFLLLFSLWGTFLLGKGVYLSSQVSDSICEQHRKFVEAGELQKPVKSGSGSGSENETCGWYQIQNGKDEGCPASRVSDLIDCSIAEERASSDFATQEKDIENRGGRIVGGEEAGRHEFPSTLINYNSGYQKCADTLIFPEWVVTAAHCVKPEFLQPYFEVVAGEHNQNETDEENPARQRRKIVWYKKHENYASLGFGSVNDIAVMKVSPPFELNEYVKLVTLPEPLAPTEGVVTAVGWGAVRENGPRSDILLKVDLPLVDDATCNKSYNTENLTVYESMICAGEEGKDSCQGDSGGPLYKIDGDKTILVGITSWGYGCAVPGFPGIYTEVSYFVDWILKNTCMT